MLRCHFPTFTDEVLETTLKDNINVVTTKVFKSLWQEMKIHPC